MATLANLLALIPAGPEYQLLRDTLTRINTEFGAEMDEISGSRLTGWLEDIEGGRSVSDLRKDIFTHVVGTDVIQSTLGADADTAAKLISGEITFSDFLKETNVGGGQTTTGGVPAGEGKATTGVGGKGQDPETALTIMSSKSMKWYYDKSAGTWYVSYKMPNSDRELIFAAAPDQMNALFGTGQRPTNYENVSFAKLTKREGVTFGGNVTEVAGKGTWEESINKTIALALDEGALPSWAKGDKQVLDLIAIAEIEEKDDEWLYTQISKLDSFKARFPQLGAFQKSGNLTLVEAVTGFLEFEGQVKQMATQYGSKASITADVIGGLLTRGYSTKFVADAFSSFDRYAKNKDAFAAFNQILKAKGQVPITTTKGIFNFLNGRAPQEQYQVYEEAALREAAVASGIGKHFTAKEAIAAAKHNMGVVNIEQAMGQMQNAAQMLLRFRDQVDTGAYGLDHDELIDLSLGVRPRSGRSDAEIRNSLDSALQGAQAFVDGGAGAYVGFGSDGTPRAQSLGKSTTQY